MPSQPGYHERHFPHLPLITGGAGGERERGKNWRRVMRAHNRFHMHEKNVLLSYSRHWQAHESEKEFFPSCPICVENVAEKQQRNDIFPIAKGKRVGECDYFTFSLFLTHPRPTLVPSTQLTRTSCPVLLNPVPFFIKIKKKFIRTHGAATEL